MKKPDFFRFLLTLLMQSNLCIELIVCAIALDINKISIRNPLREFILSNWSSKKKANVVCVNIFCRNTILDTKKTERKDLNRRNRLYVLMEWNKCLFFVLFKISQIGFIYIFVKKKETKSVSLLRKAIEKRGYRDFIRWIYHLVQWSNKENRNVFFDS